ncbi:MAG: sugar phosphate nucleotidyltransferase [bacterium]
MTSAITKTKRFPTPRQALLMAAGRGKRLRPLTDTVPKPMIEVAGHPILEWSIAALPAGIEEVVIVVGYLKEAITDHFGQEWNGRSVRYVEQSELKGTGHVVHVARPLLDSRFMVLNGDDLYLPSDLERLAGYELSALGLRLDDNGRFGLLSVDRDGWLTGITRDEPQGSGGLVNIGAYVIDQRYFDYDLVPVGDGSEFGLPHTIASMSPDHRIKVVEAESWFPIGFPQDIGPAEEWIRKHRTEPPDKIRRT